MEKRTLAHMRQSVKKEDDSSTKFPIAGLYIISKMYIVDFIIIDNKKDNNDQRI